MKLLTVVALLVLVSIATTREEHEYDNVPLYDDEGSADGDWDNHDGDWDDMSGAGQLAISALTALVPVMALY